MAPYIVVVVVAAAVVLFVSLWRVRALGALLPSAISGLLGLAAVHLSSLWGPALLALNPFTVCVAAFLGIPGVVGMLVLRLIAAI